MLTTSIFNRPVAVAVEYASRGKRVRKTFADAYEARRFYGAKLRAGKDPAVKKVQG